MPVFFIASDQARGGRITITPPLLEHLRNSLRVRAGDEIWCGDECRRRYRVRVTDLSPRTLTGTILEERHGSPPHPTPLILVAAVLKGDRMDWLVQKAVELGVAVIRPVVTARVVVRPKSGRHHQERWQCIAAEAAQQSEQWEIPRVEPVATLEETLADRSAATRVLLAERQAGSRLGEMALQPDRPVVLLVGPEGGWADEEVNEACRVGFLRLTLGEAILRAETAAVAAIAVVQHRLGRLG